MNASLVMVLVALPLLALTVAWWRWADARVRRLPRPSWFRIPLATFALLFLSGVTGYVVTRLTGALWTPPLWWVSGVMLWGLAGLPLLAVPLMLGAGVRRVTMAVRRRRRSRTIALAENNDSTVTRRQWLAAGFSLAPMIFTVGLTGASVLQNRRFRIRRIAVDLPQLPEALDGMTIAHVSDTHVGKFTRGDVLDQVAAATNALDADLVLFTGDLIDSSLEELPAALSIIDRIRRDERFFAIEGNHDLLDGRDAFEQAARSAGMPLLLDQTATVQVRGRPVQIMGTRWPLDSTAFESVISARVDRVAALRDPDAFPILLAHHPHAFDRAAEHRIPLTLAGHTHGGQLMLTPEFGVGPMLFRYWSGLYRRQDARLVVSNGVGNWFPLRSHAPAEIVHLTLRRACASNGEHSVAPAKA